MTTQANNKINYYDDKDHNYEDFWQGRDYEHNAEMIAIDKLLNGRHFSLAMDYGGGYGRVTPKLLEYSDRVILVDPSVKQLNAARVKLKGLPVDYELQATKDTVPAKDNSLDLLVMIRVTHHLPEPGKVFSEIYRTLKPDGIALIEIANEAHFINRMRYLTRFKGVPKTPVPIGERANGRGDDTPFVNHNPLTVESTLKQIGFRLEAKLSVSNLRRGILKRHLSPKTMLAIENSLQRPLAKVNFGPSIFLLVRKGQ
jgi:SAM-dependent methyltransferase